MSPILRAVWLVVWLVPSCVVPAQEPKTPAGFRAIFNGRDLTGWYGLNPEPVANLHGNERQAALKKMRDEFPQHWRVEDGELVNDGTGPYATTELEYGNIELRIEYKIVPKVDGGIYLRGTTQVQIWDINRPNDPAQPHRNPYKGSGGLSNKSSHSRGREPLLVADKPIGQWNSLRIRQLDNKTWVWLNDKLVVNGAEMENYKMKLPSKGPILLKSSAGEIRWRNIFVHEIDPIEEIKILIADDEVKFLKTHAELMQELEYESELDLTGHPAPYGSLPLYLGSTDGWNIVTAVDDPALKKYAIRFDDAFPYYQLRTSGASRRSSLRFILASCGLGYYVDGNRLLVTTAPRARAKWAEELEKPDPKSLSSAVVRDRRLAAFAVGYWPVDPEPWVGPLVECLRDSDRQVCFDAAYALGEFGPQAEKAVAGLVELLRSKDLTLREAAVFALGRIGTRASFTLLKVVDDADAEIGVAGAKSFEVMGSVGKQAVPDLIGLAKRHADDRNRCDQIGLAIANIDPVGAVPSMQILLASESSGIRAFAANACAEIGPPAVVCAEKLVPLLFDADEYVRADAARAVSYIELPKDFPTAELKRAANSSDRNVQLWAEQALRKIESKKKE